MEWEPVRPVSAARDAPQRRGPRAWPPLAQPVSAVLERRVLQLAMLPLGAKAWQELSWSLIEPIRKE